MFAVDNILISDDLVDAPFACNLGACKGACCVQGASGAPLEEDERSRLEEILPLVWKDLTPEGRDVIDREGTWEEVGPGNYATTCVDNSECVFVIYDGPVAKCAIHKAYLEGRVDFPKPISCHLYPIRIEDLGTHEALNYEQIHICTPAKHRGRREGIQLGDFLEEPLTRRYGKDWYSRFREALEERRSILNGS